MNVHSRSRDSPTPAKVRAGRPPGAEAPTGLLTRDAAMMKPNLDSALNNQKGVVTGSKKTLLARSVPTQKQGLAHLQGAHIPNDQHQLCMCCAGAARRYHPQPIFVVRAVLRCKRRKFLVIRQPAFMTTHAITTTLLIPMTLKKPKRVRIVGSARMKGRYLRPSRLMQIRRTVMMKMMMITGARKAKASFATSAVIREGAAVLPSRIISKMKLWFTRTETCKMSLVLTSPPTQSTNEVS